jgi:hypothetical protein
MVDITDPYYIRPSKKQLKDLLEVSNKETFFDVVHYNFWMLIGSIAERLFVRMK